MTSRHHKFPPWRWLPGAALALLLCACGGGGAPDITGTGDDSDEGEVSGFGSVIVNGTRYATGSATRFEVEGQGATEQSLKLGMVVTVSMPAGEVGTDGALATRIVFRSAVEGRIESVDQGGGEFDVLGLSVLTTELTRFFNLSGEPMTGDGLNAGDIVRVSGFRRADGSINATYVGVLPPRSDSFLVRGRVSLLNTSMMRFELNGLLVDYSQAASIQGSLDDGDSVEVAGDKSADGQRFVASRVTELQDAQADRPARGGLQGVVSSVVSGSACPNLSFAVNDGHKVQTSASTVYQGGSCSDIRVDRRIGVLGSYRSDGTLAAERVAIYPDINALVQAEVEMKTAGAVTSADAAPQCNLRLLGDLDVRIDGRTRQGEPEADSAAGSRSFSCNDIEIGDLVAVIGAYDQGAGRIDAQIVQPARRATTPAGFDGVAAVGGELQALNAGARQFEVLGTLVQINNDTDFGESSEFAFYTQTQAGDLVAAAGFWDGSVLQASVVRSGRIDPSKD